MIGSVAWWVTVIGALNIGLVNIMGKDLLASLVGGDLMRVVYIIVGVAAIWMLLERFGVVKN